MKIKLGSVETLFGIFLITYIVCWLVPGTSLLQLSAGIGTIFFAIWAGIRLWRWLAKYAVWRLRNRLVIAYLFIAVAPILLITVLLGLGGYILLGQFSIYLIGSEMERRSASLRETAEVMMRHPPSGKELVPAFLRQRYPGFQAVGRNSTQWVYPSDAAIQPPPAEWPDISGLLLKDRALYGWAHVRKGAASVTVLHPISRDYLAELASGLGETNVFRVDETQRSHPVVIPKSAAEEVAQPASANRLPPQMNPFDIEIQWMTALPLAIWDSPGKPEEVLITLRTRPSALWRTIFVQRIGAYGDVLQAAFFVVVLLLVVAEVIALRIGISLTHHITASVHDLYEGTQRITRGDFTHRIPSKGKDQLAELSTSFNQMTQNVQRLLQVEKETQRLQSELEIAREVQTQLYPKETPDMPTLRITAMWDPARMVSGDYYDYQLLGPSKVSVVVGDVAGKGISAALLMATVQSSFRSQLRSSLEYSAAVHGDAANLSISTAHLVSNLNQQLYAYTAPEKFSTLFFGVYDEPTRTLSYTNAGHLPPILIRSGACRRLDVNGMVVGAFAQATYDSSELTLEPGDLLVFFTDGITEPEDAYGEMFGEDRLTDLLIKNAALDESELVRLIVRSVRQWTGSAELQDDMTLLLVRSR